VIPESLGRRAVWAGLLLLILLLPLRAIAVPGAGPVESDRAKDYRDALRVDPDNLSLHYQLGLERLAGGDDQSAVDELRLAYPAFTASADMHYRLGLAFTHLGDLDSAQLYFAEAESLGALARPDLFPLADAYDDLATAYLEKDDCSAARPLLERVLAMDPQRLEARRLLGDCLARSGDVDAALEQFSRYLEHYPDDSTARDELYALHFNRGLKQIEDNDLAAANASFTAALQAAPESPVALYYLGAIAYRQGHFEPAAGLLAPIYAAAPPELRSSIRSMLYACALALFEHRRPEPAQKAAAPLLTGEKAAARDFFLMGNIELARKDFAAATSSFQRGLALEPGNAGAATELRTARRGALDGCLQAGRRHLAEGRARQAREQFTKALALDPGNARARAGAEQAETALAKEASAALARARAALRQNNPHQALVEVQSGLALTPDAATGRELRQRALDQLQQEIATGLAAAQQRLAAGDPGAAASAYQQVLALAPGEPRAAAALVALADRTRTQALDAIARGDQALEEGHLDAARQAFGAAGELAPGLPEVQAADQRLATMVASLAAEESLWGRRARSAGRLREAGEHFAKALGLADSPAIRQELAEVEAARAKKAAHLLEAARQAAAGHQFNQARRLYLRLAELDPAAPTGREEPAPLESQLGEFVAAEVGRAREALAGGQPAAALASFRRVLEVAPANPEARAGLEKVRGQLDGRLAELVRDANRALGAGRFSTAEGIFRQALAIDPYQPEARAALGRIDRLRLSGVNPGDQQKLFSLGLAFYTRGKYPEAIEAWRQVLLLDPGDKRARSNIEMTRHQLQHSGASRKG
jgi:tetratricopeptide (TPR) repeat protein